jgi:hypothetical protein
MRNAFVFLLVSVALLTATTLSTPAAAKGASLGAVQKACQRTQGCVIQYHGNGNADGCTAVVCFTCTKGVCVQALKDTHQPIKGGNLNGLLNPPESNPMPKEKNPVVVGGANQSGKINQPVAVEHSGNIEHSGGGGGGGGRRK